MATITWANIASLNRDPNMVSQIEKEDQDRQLLVQKVKAQKNAKATADFVERQRLRDLALELAIQREAIEHATRLEELPKKYGSFWFNKVEGTNEDCLEAETRRIEHEEFERYREQHAEDERKQEEAREKERNIHRNQIETRLKELTDEYNAIDQLYIFNSADGNHRYLLRDEIATLQEELLGYEIADQEEEYAWRHQSEWEYISLDRNQKRRQAEEEQYERDVEAGFYVNMLKERFAEFDETVLKKHGPDIKRKMMGAFNSRNY